MSQDPLEIGQPATYVPFQSRPGSRARRGQAGRSYPLLWGERSAPALPARHPLPGSEPRPRGADGSELLSDPVRLQEGRRSRCQDAIRSPVVSDSPSAYLIPGFRDFPPSTQLARRLTSSSADAQTRTVHGSVRVRQQGGGTEVVCAQPGPGVDPGAARGEPCWEAPAEGLEGRPPRGRPAGGRGGGDRR